MSSSALESYLVSYFTHLELLAIVHHAPRIAVPFFRGAKASKNVTSWPRAWVVGRSLGLFVGGHGLFQFGRAANNS